MNIDPLTVLIALLVVYAILVVDLFLARRSFVARSPELRSWALGSAILLLGFLSFGLRRWLPLGVSIVLSNGLIAAGMLYYTDSVRRFVLGKRLPLGCWVLFGGGLGLLTVMAVLSVPYVHHLIVVSFWMALLLIPMLQVLLKEGWHAETSLRTMAISMLVCCTALVVRGVHAMIDPASYGELLQLGWMQGLTMLAMVLTAIGSGFGFMLANLERAVGQLEFLASRDDLTGCYNRATARTMLEHLLERCRRERTPLALLLLDLDHFKQVNDQHGHQVGDQVLRRFAEAVHRRLRASDVFGRMGGEEFCIALPMTDRVGALELAEQLRLTVAGLDWLGRDDAPFRVTVSVGLVVVGGQPIDDVPAMNLEQVYRAADDLLYRAKHLGRNRVMVA